MVEQARRAPLANNKFGGIPCLHFDGRTGVRCGRFAGEGVFCSLPNHACDWEALSEEEQVRFNAMLTNPVVAYDAPRWAEVFEQYRNAKEAVRQASAIGSLAEGFAASAEKVAAAKKEQEERVEQSRRRVKGVWRCR